MTAQKIVVITGGHRGLGRADALALAATGVDVVLTYRSGKDEATPTSKGSSSSPRHCFL